MLIPVFICTAVTLKSQLNSELLMWCGKTNRLDSRWRKKKLVRYQSCRNMIVTSLHCGELSDKMSQSSSLYIICIPWKYWHWWGNCMNAIAQCCDVIFNSTINKTPQKQKESCRKCNGQRYISQGMNLSQAASCKASKIASASPI